MKIRTLPAPPLPKTLKDLMSNQPQQNEPPPGFLVNVGGLLDHNPPLYQTISSIYSGSGDTVKPCLVVSPDQVSSIFDSPEARDLIKAVGGWVAKQIHPNLKTAYDIVWFVYGANELRKSWERPDRDSISCLIKLAGLGMKATAVVGDAYPNLKAPDHWANGINFIVKSGSDFYEGKTPPINEMILSSDKRLSIPLKLLKFAGVALDPQIPDIRVDLISTKEKKRKGSK